MPVSPMRQAASANLKKPPKKMGLWEDVKDLWGAIGGRQGDRSGYRHATEQLEDIKRFEKPIPKPKDTTQWPLEGIEKPKDDMSDVWDAQRERLRKKYEPLPKVGKPKGRIGGGVR